MPAGTIGDRSRRNDAMGASFERSAKRTFDTATSSPLCPNAGQWVGPVLVAATDILLEVSVGVSDASTPPIHWKLRGRCLGLRDVIERD